MITNTETQDTLSRSQNSVGKLIDCLCSNWCVSVCRGRKSLISLNNGDQYSMTALLLESSMPSMRFSASPEERPPGSPASISNEKQMSAMTEFLEADFIWRMSSWTAREGLRDSLTCYLTSGGQTTEKREHPSPHTSNEHTHTSQLLRPAHQHHIYSIYIYY